MALRPSKTLARRAARVADPESLAATETLDALKAARALSRDLGRYEERLVAAARRERQSWAAIGRALDCSKQSAFERYSHLEKGKR